MVIQIIKCTSAEAWYRKLVGKNYEVIEMNGSGYVVHKGRFINSFVIFSDAKVLNSENENSGEKDGQMSAMR